MSEMPKRNAERKLGVDFVDQECHISSHLPTDHQPRLDAWDKRSDLVHWENLEGAGGEGGGSGDRDGEHM